MKNPTRLDILTKCVIAAFALTVISIFTAATPPDRNPVQVDSNYILVGAYSNIFAANKAAASNAWSTTFTPSNALLNQVSGLTVAGNAGKAVGVNAGGTALELITVSGGGNTAYAQVLTTMDTTNRSTTSAVFTNSFVEVTLTNELASVDSEVEISVQGVVGASGTSGILFTLYSWDGVTLTDLKQSSVNALDGVICANNAVIEKIAFTFVHTNITSTTPLTYRLGWSASGGATAYLGRRGSDTFYDVPTYITAREKIR